MLSGGGGGVEKNDRVIVSAARKIGVPFRICNDGTSIRTSDCSYIMNGSCNWPLCDVDIWLDVGGGGVGGGARRPNAIATGTARAIAQYSAGALTLPSAVSSRADSHSCVYVSLLKLHTNRCESRARIRSVHRERARAHAHAHADSREFPLLDSARLSREVRVNG